MHATLNFGGSSLMVSDGNSTEPSGFKGFSLSLGVGTTEEAERIFNALLPGGNAIVPLGKTFWSPAFGMLDDKFGMGWMVIAS